MTSFSASDHTWATINIDSVGKAIRQHRLAKMTKLILLAFTGKPSWMVNAQSKIASQNILLFAQVGYTLNMQITLPKQCLSLVLSATNLELLPTR